MCKQTPEQKAAAARNQARRDFAHYLQDEVMPSKRLAIGETGGREPAYTAAWRAYDHTRDVWVAIATLEGFPDPVDEADADAMNRAYVTVAAAACDPALLPPALMAQWARALGAARYEGQGSNPVLGSLFVFMVPSKGNPGDWRRVVICRAGAGDGCGCPGHATHGHCFHCDSARALAVAMGLIPPPVNATVFVADDQEFSTREEAEIYLAQAGKRGAAVDEVPVADLPSAGDYDRMDAEEPVPRHSPPRALKCEGPTMRPRPKKPRKPRQQSVSYISPAFAAQVQSGPAVRDWTAEAEGK